jgi:hypothetical protein
MLASQRLIVTGVLAFVAASCGGGTAVSLATQPSPVSLAPGTFDPKSLMVFREPSGFSTTDLYDAHDRVIQFTSNGELVLVADGTRVPGFAMSTDSAPWGPPTYFIGFATGKCADFCVFSVRFGTAGGQRRAFLTIDYGHNNPGTLVDVEVVGGALVVTQSTRYPPGTPTLSGIVTDAQDGITPVADAQVCGLVPGGWQCGSTDVTGRYSIPGLIDGPEQVDALKNGYQTASKQVTLAGDLRFDIQLARR